MYSGVAWHRREIDCAESYDSMFFTTVCTNANKEKHSIFSDDVEHVEERFSDMTYGIKTSLNILGH